jgi:hypothetical protein
MELIDYINPIFCTLIAILCITGIVSVMIISHYEENIEDAPCLYMKFSEKIGHGINVSEVWDRRVECGLINDSFEVRGVEE